MSKAGSHITLVIPGLCGPGSNPAFLDSLKGQFPALERLLSRSRYEQCAVNNLDSSLCRHFNLQGRDDAALPVAALTCLVDIDVDNLDVGYMLRADPVHLQADRSILRLFDSRTFSVTQDEADALVAAFNEFYSDRGWRLTAPCPQRWYLSLPEVPVITTVSPAMVAGQAVDPNLPHGRDAAEWHALMNEVQMLLHQHPVNAQREERGEPTINSLWFWGEGRLPDTAHRPDIQVATDYPLAMGLASYTHTPRRDVPADLDELLASGDETLTLVVFDDLEAAVQYANIETWLETMNRLEQHWFVPLLAALGNGRVASLEIDPCTGRSYRTSRRQQQHFWKRVRPLASVCQHG